MLWSWDSDLALVSPESNALHRKGFFPLLGETDLMRRPPLSFLSTTVPLGLFGIKKQVLTS